MPGAVELKNDIWTYQEYLEIPPDGRVYQIIRGELYMVPAPATYHQEVAINLTLIIWNYVKKTGWGKIYSAPIDVIFTSTDIVQPDIVGISKDRFGIVRENGIFGAPDFVVEILSPSTHSIDVKLKKALYERHGVFEYWLVYPEEKKVESLLLRQGSYTGPKAYLRDEEAEVASVPGLKVNLNEVF